MFRRTGPGHRSIQGGSDKRLPAFRSTIGRVVETHSGNHREATSSEETAVRPATDRSGKYHSYIRFGILSVKSQPGGCPCILDRRRAIPGTGNPTPHRTRSGRAYPRCLDRCRQGTHYGHRRADFRPVTRSKQQQTRCSLRPTSYPYVGRWDESVAQFRHGARISGRICRTYPGYHGKRRDIP